MTTQDVGTAARLADVAQCQLQDAVGAGVVVAGGVLSTAHTPHHAARTIVGQTLGHVEHLCFGHAGNVFDDAGWELGDFGPHVVHAVHALVDVLAIFPAVFEDVPQQAPDVGHVRTGANAHVLVGFSSGAGKARVRDDDVAVVALLGDQNVLHGHRVGFTGVGANEEHRFAVMHIVERVGHRSVTPGIRNARHSGGVANTRLVIGVVGAPHGGELAHQVRLLVTELGRPQPVNAVGAVGVAQFQQLVANLIDGVVPAQALPFTGDQFHRVLQAASGVAVLAERRTFGTVSATVDRVVEGGLLLGPDALLNLGIHTAAYRAVGADGALRFYRGVEHRRFISRFSALHHRRAHKACRSHPTGGYTRAL